MQFYKITMNNPGLVLSPNPAAPNNSILQLVNDSGDFLQHWSLPYCPWTTTPDWGFAIMNRVTGQIIQAQSEDSGASIVMADYNTSSLSNLNTWTIANASDYPGYVAIRPSGDSDLNLNAQGDSWPVGTAIILYEWDGTKNNMTWKFSLVPSYF